MCFFLFNGTEEYLCVGLWTKNLKHKDGVVLLSVVLFSYLEFSRSKVKKNFDHIMS